MAKRSARFIGETRKETNLLSKAVEVANRKKYSQEKRKKSTVSEYLEKVFN
jgi:hypothetical protein